MKDLFPAWDSALVLSIQQLHNPWLDNMMVAISGTFVWIPLYAALLFWFYKWIGKDALWILLFISVLVLITDQVTSALMKPYFMRLRPCHDPTLALKLHVPDGCGGRFGFASSHAANTFGLASFSWFLFRHKNKWIGLLWLWAVLVSISRIYLGKHYPTDILVGGFIGILAGFLIQFLYVKFIELKTKKFATH